MKIEEICSEAKQPVFTSFSDIAIGTVFKYRSFSDPSRKNLFLRVSAGLVNLTRNTFYPASSANRYEDYTPFPAARVVLK